MLCHGAAPDAGCLVVTARQAVPPGVKLGDCTLGVVDRVWPDEARVDADVDERGAGTEHTHDLSHEAAEVVDVRMREDRDGRVEGGILEGERGCVGEHSL